MGSANRIPVVLAPSLRRNVLTGFVNRPSLNHSGATIYIIYHHRRLNRVQSNPIGLCYVGSMGGREGGGREGG